MKQNDSPNFVINADTYLWLLCGDYKRFLQNCVIKIIEKCGRSWEFTIESVVPSDSYIDTIHNSDLAVCWKDTGRPDKFEFDDVILQLSNCAEIGRRYSNVSGFDGDASLTILEIDFVTGNLVSFDREL